MLLHPEISNCNNKMISVLGLNTKGKPSHNEKGNNEMMIEFVKFIARCAAEEDYQFYLDALAQKSKSGG